MYEVNKLSQDFIKSWKKGWPEYVHMPEQDNRPIIEIAEKCARVAKVDLDTVEGFNRILRALEVIAEFCKNDKDWRPTNLYQINQALQTVLQKMNAEKARQREAEIEHSAADRIYNDQKRARELAEREMEESRKKAKKWHDENWNDELEQKYQQWQKSLTPGRVITMDLAKEKNISKAL